MTAQTADLGTVEALASRQGTFARLPARSSAASSRSVRVCLATPEIAGPIFTGGVGRFYASLADALVRQGHQVTIAYALGEQSERGRIGDWVEHYAARDVSFVPVPEVSPPLDAPLPRQRASRVYWWLRERDGEFDVVHVPEWQGVGFYALKAKRQGLAFSSTTFVVVCHSPTMYLAPNHLQPVHHPDYLELDFLERGSVESADYLVSPSAFMLHWMHGEQWRMPERCFIHPLIVPRELRASSQDCAKSAVGSEPPGESRRAVRELVFFGRLDVLKGLDTFCAALDQLAGSDVRPQSVAFLGRDSVVNGVSSRIYLEQRAAAWPFPCSVHTDLDTAGALAYLRRPARLAVTASRIENSPNTVYECLGSRIPFVVSAVGGVSELIHERDRSKVLFTPRPDDLAALLQKVLEHGATVARPAIDFDDVEQRWIGLHEVIVEEADGGRLAASVDEPADSTPLVSVCLTHYNRHALLEQTLASLEAQDYAAFEVVLVDDASTDPASRALVGQLESRFAARGWQIVRHDRNRDVGAARNTAARHARGDLLLFMDQGDYAKPTQISTLVRIANHTDADIVTCAADVLTHEGVPRANETPAYRSLPLGPALAVGLASNCFGNGNALVRRSAFDRLEGFTEDWGVGGEDWELYARAAFAGLRHEVVCEPLHSTPRRADGLAGMATRTATLLRVLRAYLAHTTPELHGLFYICQATIAARVPPPGILAATSTPPRAEIDPSVAGIERFDLYWNSTSWRMTRPLRVVNRRRLRLTREIRPVPTTPADADMLVQMMTDSLSWKLTSPVRAVGRLRHAVRKRPSR
jgi:glycosyltransferase involved in cell wall biosynthesis